MHGVRQWFRVMRAADFQRRDSTWADLWRFIERPTDQMTVGSSVIWMNAVGLSKYQRREDIIRLIELDIDQAWAGLKRASARDAAWIGEP